MKRLYIFPFLFLFFSSLTGFLFAQDANEEVVEISTVEALLALVKEGKTQEQAANDDRENKFLANKNKQASILAAEKRELVRQENIADKLEAEYKKNEEILRVKEDAYKKELGSLVELFGHLQSSAGEAAVQFSGSLTGAEYGQDRVKFLNELTGKMSETTELPTIREIEGLWYELTRELAASAQVVSFTTDVIDVDGVTSECSVTRVGLFNAAKAVGNASVGEQVRFGIDPTGPTGGSLLANLFRRHH
jgi:biopolymer transport protein ExbB